MYQIMEGIGYRNLSARVCPGVKPYEPTPGSYKVMRLHAQTVTFENGQVFLPCEVHWLAKYVKELNGFLGGWVAGWQA